MKKVFDYKFVMFLASLFVPPIVAYLKSRVNKRIFHLENAPVIEQQRQVPKPARLVAMFFSDHHEFKNDISRDLDDAYVAAYDEGGKWFANLYICKKSFGIMFSQIGPWLTKLIGVYELWKKISK